MKIKWFFKFVCILLINFNMCVYANAEIYPSKTIKIVVPFAAGTATDILARMVAQHLSDVFKNPVIVENKAGANGVIGANAVAKAAPDGYTILFTTNTTQAANPSLLKVLPYKPLVDFSPISLIGKGVFVLASNPEAPFNTLDQMLSYAKANPGKISYATANSSGIVSGAMLASNAGIDWVHIPYKSGPTAIADTLGGQVTTVFLDLQSGMPHIKSGKLKGIALTSAKVSQNLPAIAPMSRAPGMENFDLNYWMAVYAPAATPVNIINSLNREIVDFTKKPDILKKFSDLGFLVAGSSPSELGRFTANEVLKWKSLIDAAGIVPE